MSTPEIFTHWLQSGRVEVGFLGAAQVDKFANLNSTVIGPYESPKVRLPGAGGAPEIAALAKETLIIIEHDKRKLVERVDFVTSAGYLRGGNERSEVGLSGGPSAVITDLVVFEPDSVSKELVVTKIHAGVTKEQVRDSTGWDVRFANNLCQTDSPTDQELAALRDLVRRTKEARRKLS